MSGHKIITTETAVGKRIFLTRGGNICLRSKSSWHHRLSRDEISSSYCWHKGPPPVVDHRRSYLSRPRKKTKMGRAWAISISLGWVESSLPIWYFEKGGKRKKMKSAYTVLLLWDGKRRERGKKWSFWILYLLWDDAIRCRSRAHVKRSYILPLLVSFFSPFFFLLLPALQEANGLAHCRLSSFSLSLSCLFWPEAFRWLQRAPGESNKESAMPSSPADDDCWWTLTCPAVLLSS